MIIRPRYVTPAVALLFTARLAVAQAEPAFVIPPTNPRATFTQRIGTTNVEVSYSRPGMKGRPIFGALVPYDQIWRTGADNATRISFSTPVKVNGADVPAGDYELFTVPGRSAWTVIIHKRQSQWGSYTYSQANDAARVTAKPVTLAEPVETFTLGVSDLTPKSATFNIAWEKTRVPVTIEVDVVGLAVPQIEAMMAGTGTKPYFLAAMFYFENNVDINKAAEWINAAVAANPRHIGMLHRQGLILAAKGDTAGALEAAKRSWDGAQASPRELKEEYTRLNEALMKRLGRK